jgi:hypothetical protein
VADALLHIGLHKTGTTAFQQWASHNADTLRSANGIRFYEGMFGSTHYELGLLTIGPGRTMTGMVLQPQWPLTEWQENATRHVRAQAAPDDTTLLVSSECLSLLRDEREVRRVQELLAPRQLRVAVCLRSPESWLESYRQQHVRNHYLSEFRSSHAYVEPDTWLTDWDQMLRVWRNVLGDENVVTCDYDDSVARYGSSIPAVLTALGLDPDEMPPWQGFVANVTPGHTGPFARVAPTATERIRHARSRLRQIRQENPIGWPLQLVEAALRRIRLRLTDTA